MQLGLPFDVVAPGFEERDPEGADAVTLVREHALAKARAVAADAGDRPVVGVDTIVHCGGRAYGKPATADEATRTLESLAGETHEVLSGLAVLTPAWTVVVHDTTSVTFRALTPREVGTYVASGEWDGRAGGYAIQGLGAALVTRIEGDYLNVVVLAAVALVGILAERFPDVYGFC